MRTPEHRAQPRAGKRFEAELDMNYLSPGAFTVLPLDVDRIPDPPSAPVPYRLPPTSRRHRHQSFAILGEVSSSPNSRSSSPSGRVSPFKGHGFNPTGSRHVSPSVSPIPPEDPRNKPKNVSRIPKLAPQYRKSSADSIFGDKVQHVSWELNRQASQSLTSLEEKQLRRPPIPRKRLKASAFKQLSPIQGSSPEPSQSLSSPSRIPTTKSKSTPTSRLPSPTRAPSRSQSKPNITKNPKVPLNRYQHVQSKINTFNKPRATKPSSSDFSDDSEPRKRVQRKNSLKRTSSRPNLLPKTFMGGKYVKNTSDSSDAVDTKTFGSKVNDVIDSGDAKPVKFLAKVNNKVVKSNNNKAEKSLVDSTTESKTEEDTPTPVLVAKEVVKPPAEKVKTTTVTTSTTTTTTTTTTDSSASESKPAKLTKKISKIDLIKVVKPPPTSSDDVLPSAMEVVTSTTATVTKPLKIDTPKLNRSVSPLIDGRVLSATSVSQAINKMNDTVLNTQTLIKDSGLQSKLTPSPGLMFAKDDEEPEKKPETAKVNTPPATSQAQNNGKLVTAQANNNHISIAVEAPKLSANERIREARTVIAADVKPIRILVKEKPSEVEVQSGNVAPHFGLIANGTSDRPSLHPTQQQQQQPPPPAEPTKDEPPPNRCKKFLENCTKVLTCNSCQKCKKDPKATEELKERQEEEVKPGCLQCLKKKNKKQIKDQVRISIEDENGEEQTTKLWHKLNCCKKNKISDSKSCFPIGKRKHSWVERRASSFLESETQQKTSFCSREGCRGFFKKIFCCCCKKKEEELRPPPLSSRKESVVSNKKKSLTPLSVPPPEDFKPKIDASLVEHTSQMKGAIPVLPVWLAWFCCVMNCIGPGTGTVLSGLFCLCIGKPRFSQKDGPKPRIGAFIIDLIIGFSQFFTVLFCLVGWGWSIWWGVIMVKIAKKHRKFRNLEKMEENTVKPENQRRDVERGRT